MEACLGSYPSFSGMTSPQYRQGAGGRLIQGQDDEEGKHHQGQGPRMKEL